MTAGHQPGFNRRLRPNILLVVFDSLSAQAFNEHERDLPALSALRDQSLTFTNAYTCAPQGSPARASLFTGLDMAAHGVWTDGVALPKRETTLPQVFAQNGYDTWLVGRRHLAGVSGWTTEHARRNEYLHFDWAHGPLHRSRQNAYLTWLQAKAPDTYAQIFPSQPNPDAADTPAWQRQAVTGLPGDLSFNAWVGEQVCVRLAIDVPFFGVAGFVVGQTMGACGAVVESLDPRALRQADAALGKILSALPEDTVVVATAGRGSVSDAATAQPLQQSAITVPMMIRSPDHDPVLIDGVVSTMDIAPTLYELAAIRTPQRMQGRSLISAPPRGWSLSRLRLPDSPHQTALSTSDWKLVITHGDPQATSLYDLAHDPATKHDLSRDDVHQDTVETLLDLMIDARVALEDRTEPRIASF